MKTRKVQPTPVLAPMVPKICSPPAVPRFSHSHRLTHAREGASNLSNLRRQHRWSRSVSLLLQFLLGGGHLMSQTYAPGPCLAPWFVVKAAKNRGRATLIHCCKSVYLALCLRCWRHFARKRLNQREQHLSRNLDSWIPCTLSLVVGLQIYLRATFVQRAGPALNQLPYCLSQMIY